MHILPVRDLFWWSIALCHVFLQVRQLATTSETICYKIFFVNHLLNFEAPSPFPFPILSPPPPPPPPPFPRNPLYLPLPLWFPLFLSVTIICGKQLSRLQAPDSCLSDQWSDWHKAVVYDVEVVCHMKPGQIPPTRYRPHVRRGELQVRTRERAGGGGGGGGGTG